MSYTKFAIQTAKEAGRILLDNYEKMQKLEWKLKTNFKTQVDDLSDNFIRNRIRENYPTHNIYSEEQENLNQSSEYSWVCDPLDGTIPYTYGINDHFSVSIALVKNKTPILGVIYAPKRNELYFAEHGKGAFCNEKPIKVSLEKNVNHVLIGADPGKETEKFKRAAISSKYKKLYSQDGVSCAFCSGAAAVPLALTASGKLHAYFALSLEPWDMAAAVIINREAGSKVTDKNGKEWELGDESILASNKMLHSKLLKLLS